MEKFSESRFLADCRPTPSYTYWPLPAA